MFCLSELLPKIPPRRYRRQLLSMNLLTSYLACRAHQRCDLKSYRSSSTAVLCAKYNNACRSPTHADSPRSVQLGKVVAENLLAFDQKFWIRLATRVDSAPSQEEKDRIGELAGTTMRMVDALVKKTDSQISNSAAVLQRILAAAADDRGEWQIPLAEEKVEAMRKAMEVHSDALDESLLAHAFAWMRKASGDNLEGIVVLLQQFLQLYAAKALVSKSEGTEPGDTLLDDILLANESSWTEMIKSASETGEVTKSSFLASIRRRMENVVLALPSGSYAQRVQAEYLKELETRTEAFFRG